MASGDLVGNHNDDLILLCTAAVTPVDKVPYLHEESGGTQALFLPFGRRLFRLCQIGSGNLFLASGRLFAGEFLASFLRRFLSCRHGFIPFASLTAPACLIRSR